MSQPLVSVLTPVYNGEKYLAECIESVLNQDYPNWEYIIVNNCSTDRTPEIARGYAERDRRIRIHTNPSLVSAIQNHNLALRQISSESKYCKFVHADDWIFPECLSEMVKIAEAYPTVGVVCSYGLWGTRVSWDGLAYPSWFVSGREICRRSLLGGFFVFGSPTSHMMRSDLVRKYESLYNTHEFHSSYADQEACYELLQSSDFGFVHKVLTYSRLHDESRTMAFARTGLNVDMPSGLNILVKYGPVYLGQEDYQRRITKVMKRYYAFLGRSVFERKGAKFWAYHRDVLRHAGLRLDRARLARAAAWEVVDTLINPLRMAGRVLGLLGSENTT